MAWGDINRIAVALEGIEHQLARLADRLGAPALTVTPTDPEQVPPDPALSGVSYSQADLLLRAQDAEDTLELLLGRPPTAEEIDRVLAVQDG